MSEQQVQVAQAETSTTGEPPKWGEMPPPERIAALEARLAEWEQFPPETHGDPAKGEGGRSAFDVKGPQAWQGLLTGADVFYLAARVVAGSAEPGAIEAAAARLRKELLDLSALHLEGAHLTDAHLDGASLIGAHLERANLGGAHLEGADLTDASFDKNSHLNYVTLTGAHFDQVTFDNTNLTVVDWSLVDILGDERTARERKHRSSGRPNTRLDRHEDYKAAVRANRVLAVALEAQGLSEDGERFAYRAKVLQRRVLRLRRKPFAYLFSLLLALVAGYGYRIWRILAAYAAVVTFFALAYFIAGSPAIEDAFHSITGIALMNEQHVALHEAFLLSVTNIHGRVFTGTFKIESLQAWFAGAEAIFGIVIEGTFVAMLIQRFFGR
jgi:hypothetical protein